MGWVLRRLLDHATFNSIRHWPNDSKPMRGSIMHDRKWPRTSPHMDGRTISSKNPSTLHFRQHSPMEGNTTSLQVCRGENKRKHFPTWHISIIFEVDNQLKSTCSNRSARGGERPSTLPSQASLGSWSPIPAFLHSVQNLGKCCLSLMELHGKSNGTF